MSDTHLESFQCKKIRVTQRCPGSPSRSDGGPARVDISRRVPFTGSDRGPRHAGV